MSQDPNILMYGGPVERLSDEDERVTIGQEFIRVLMESGLDRMETCRDYGRTANKALAVKPGVSSYDNGQRHQADSAYDAEVDFNRYSMPTHKGYAMPFNANVSAFLLSRVNADSVPDDWQGDGPASV